MTLSSPIKAAGIISQDRRDVGVLAVTSADRLNVGWTAAQRVRANGNKDAASHIETLFKNLPRNCVLITVIDGQPATLSWLGGVWSHQTLSHGVEHFGQSGSIADLYRHFRIDAEALVGSASELSQGRKFPYIAEVSPHG